MWKLKCILVLAISLVFYCSCGDDDQKKEDGGIDSSTDSDSDTDTDADTDTGSDTNPAGDYWTDGYCGHFFDNVPASLDCKTMPPAVPGCCDVSGKTLWCEDELLWCIDCETANPYCGWNSLQNMYDCGQDALSEDPSGEEPYACPLWEPDAGVDSGLDAG